MLRAQACTRQPSPAKDLTNSRPMPRLAPVTSTVGKPLSLSRTAAPQATAGDTSRRGRATSSPPQLGQRRAIVSAQAAQKVHSKLQIKASPSIASPRSHRSQSGFICSARSEEHTSELQSLMRISYAVFCLKKKHKLTTH